MGMLFGNQSKNSGALTADAVCGGIGSDISRALLYAEDGSSVDGQTPLGTLTEVKKEEEVAVNDELNIEGNPLEILATDDIAVPGGDEIVPSDVIPSEEPQTDASDVPSGDSLPAPVVDTTEDTATVIEVSDVTVEEAPVEEEAVVAEDTAV